MRVLSRWIHVHLFGLAVGLLVTATTSVLYSLNMFEWLSMILLDSKFRHTSRAVADSRVVMIDITDYALERVHKWPWPRRYHADLIDTLTDLGARATLMDLVFDGPEAGRFDHPELDPDRDIDKTIPIHVESEQDRNTINLNEAIWDDVEFKEALARNGRVTIAMFARLYGPRFFPEKIRETVYQILDANPEITFESFEDLVREEIGIGLDRVITSAGRSALHSDPKDLFGMLRIERLLEQKFDRSGKELGYLLGVSEKGIELHLAAAKRNVARRLVGRFFRNNPEADWPATFSNILPHISIQRLNADRDDLLRAFRAISSERHINDDGFPVPESLVGRIRNASDLTLPLDKLAEVAGVGLVSFEADRADGVVRRVALVAKSGDTMLKQLGFALAVEVLDIDESTIRLEEGEWLVMENRSGDREWRIPIDDEGRTLLNWHIDPAKPQWQHSFVHIPVARIMQIPDARRQLVRIQERLTLHRIQYVEIATPHLRTEYVRLVRRRDSLRRSRDQAEHSIELARLEQQIEGMEQEAIETVLTNGAGIREAMGENPQLELTESEQEYLDLAIEYESGGTEKELGESKDAMEEIIRTRTADLLPQIRENVCLIGYSATAVADTVNTPVFDEAPGVMAHANVVNSMFLGQFPSSPGRWTIVALIVATGILATVVTVWRDPWVSLASMLLIVAVLHVAAFGAFYVSTYDVDTVGPLVAVVGSWMFVTLYRQMTEERQKRAFSKSLAAYTSPAIAAKLAEQVTRQSGALDLTPQARIVTCFFSDLKGFTSISERLGAERTREVLNPYLEAMSAVLIKSDAMINKFMGDGIFAFYNPPIHPVEQHARAACEATLESFVALDRLKDELGHGELEHEVRDLSMRIGVNTGEVFVGDYGSSNKLDYTCIGDTVNLSARLEPACKPFGIQAMVSESTLKGAGDGYVVRHLGGLQVVGKKEGVQVYELIGRQGEVDNSLIEYAGVFGEAVKRFQERDWDGTLAALAQCRKMRSVDLATDLLETNARRHKENQPPEDWNRAIELTSK